jgi:hypothetical protein
VATRSDRQLATSRTQERAIVSKVRGAKSRQKASSLDDEDLYDLIGRLKSAARKALMAVKDRTTAVAGLPDLPWYH